MARSSNIVMFFFRKSVSRKFRKSMPIKTDRKDEVIVVEGGAENTNLSLDVAAKFGIMPDQLPGIVFFGDNALSGQSAKGVFWPIPAEAFLEERGLLEHEFAHLFALVQKARSRSCDAMSMLHELETMFAAMRAAEAGKPFIALLGKGLVRIVTYPGMLIEVILTSVSKGYGEGLAAKI